jgi:hypothetical protein
MGIGRLLERAASAQTPCTPVPALYGCRPRLEACGAHGPELRGAATARQHAVAQGREVGHLHKDARVTMKTGAAGATRHP